MAHIYRIVRAGTDQCYVGHTTMPIGDRWKAHRYHLNVGTHHSSYLQRAWLKDGASQFVFEVVEECPDEDKVVREQFYMDTLNSVFNGRPAADSNLGYKYTDEQKARMSLAQQNNLLAGQHRVGVKETAEITEARMVAVRRALQERPLVWVTDGEDNIRCPTSDPIPSGWSLGRTFGEDHKAASLKASSGPRTPEVKAAIKAGHATIWDDPEKRKRMMENRRPFTWYTDGTKRFRVADGDPIPEGLRLGMPDGHFEGLKWINDGSEGRRIPKDDPIPEGWQLGFPPKAARNPELEPARIAARLAAGETISAIALDLGVALSSIHRARNKAKQTQETSLCPPSKT